MIINVNKICNRINYNLERISRVEYLNQIKFGNNYYEKKHHPIYRSKRRKIWF